MGFSVHLRASKFNEKKFSLFLDLHDLVFQCLTKQKDIDKYWQKKKMGLSSNWSTIRVSFFVNLRITRIRLDLILDVD